MKPKFSLDTALKVTIGALFAVLAWVIVSSMREPVVQAGDKAPAFTITTDQGKRLTPTSFGGKVLVLNFWAAWCEPCAEETPSLNEFQQVFQNAGVVVLGISVDKNARLYENFLKRFNVQFETARDPDANIASSYGTFKYPETYIIDTSGKVVQKVIGPRNWLDPAVINYIKSLL